MMKSKLGFRLWLEKHLITIAQLTFDLGFTITSIWFRKTTLMSSHHLSETGLIISRESQHNLI